MAASAFWTLAGAVFSRGFTLLTYVMMARLLGKDTYGKWGLVQTTLATFAMLGVSGVGMTATKHVAEFRLTDPRRAGRILSLALTVTLFTITAATLANLLLARPMAEWLFRVRGLESSLLLGSILLFSMAGAQVVQGSLAGFEDFRGIARNNLAQGFLLLALAYPLTRWGGLNGMVVAIGLSWALTLLLGLRLLVGNCRKNGVPLVWKGIWRERGILSTFTLPCLISDGISCFAMLQSQAFVSRIPGGIRALGGYSASAQWRDILLFVPDSVRRITLPMLSRLRGQREGARYVKATLANVALNGGIAIAGAVPLMILSPWILSLYGPGFSSDWPIMVAMLLAGVLQSVRDVVMQVTASMSRIWFNTAVGLVWSATMLGLTAYLVPRQGVMGFVVASVIAMAASTLLYLAGAIYLIRRREHISVPDNSPRP
jgi:O-antigen/teichoic acid export membrane protein